MKFVSGILLLVRSLFSARYRRINGEIRRLKRMIAMVEATDEHEIACEEAYRLLDQYADRVVRGEQSEPSMEKVKQHLAMCMDCREEFESLLLAIRSSGV